MSHALLRELSQDGITIGFEGFPWQTNDERKKLPANRLVSKILCKRHNEALAGLDKVAKRLFMSIDAIDKSFGDSPQPDAAMVSIFNGHDIERWMLKTLCGLVYSRNSSSQSGRIENWTPSLRWLKILFRQDRFGTGWGLYVLGSIRHVNVINRIFACAPISDDRLGVYGLVTILNDKKFTLAMMRPPASKQGTILEGHVYRPAELAVAGGNVAKIIRLSWNSPGEGGRVLIHYGS